MACNDWHQHCFLIVLRAPGRCWLTLSNLQHALTRNSQPSTDTGPLTGLAFHFSLHSVPEVDSGRSHSRPFFGEPPLVRHETSKRNSEETCPTQAACPRYAQGQLFVAAPDPWPRHAAIPTAARPRRSVPRKFATFVSESTINVTNVAFFRYKRLFLATMSVASVQTQIRFWPCVATGTSQQRDISPPQRD